MKTLSIWYPSLITRNSSRAWQPLSRVNVTGLLRRLQVKIENIYLFKTLIKKHGNVFKSWLCPNFSCPLKNLSCPKFGGAAAPLVPPPPPRPVRLCPRFRFSEFFLFQNEWLKAAFFFSKAFKTRQGFLAISHRFFIFISQVKQQKRQQRWIKERFCDLWKMISLTEQIRDL